MLYAWGFDKIGVAVSDLFFVDNAVQGDDGAEQGVRLEVRLFERSPLKGSRYSAQPIEIDRPIWRADLLESVHNPGSLDHAHHHPRFRGWEPGRRTFVEEMRADPVAWVGKRLIDFDALLDEAGVDVSEVGPDDPAAVRDAAPEILDAVRRLLDRVRSEDLAARAQEVGAEGARVSWL